MRHYPLLLSPLRLPRRRSCIMQGVGSCPLLLRIDASHNALRGLSGPQPLPSWSPHSVRPVNAAASSGGGGGGSDDSSQLSSSLMGCTLLQYLNISCNAVAQLDAVLIAAPFCPGLVSLDLR